MTTPAADQPFDDIRRLIAAMPGPDRDAAAAVRRRDRSLTKPAGSLGRLEELAEWLAAWQGNPGKPRPLQRLADGAESFLTESGDLR